MSYHHNHLPKFVKNCCVLLKDQAKEKNQEIWRVSSHTIDERGRENIFIFNNTNKKQVQRNDLSCGFQINYEVIDWPELPYMKRLGMGIVISKRQIANSEQLLIEFIETGQKLWLPYYRLSQIKGVKHRFLTSNTVERNSSEKFRLKCLAYAIEMWNENTGALSDLDIDPLPHQINLVHHILASGNLNWLIADDVGLGKTIETGMLLSALIQKNSLKKILLVCPAGLTRQWQEELANKFNLSHFRIFGEDFQINDSRHWKLYEFVIASIDRLKDEKYLETLHDAGQWDLVIFDEAHRLSRRQYGMKYEISDRFKLARELRKYTESMLLLSATPHQGMKDKFIALLELLRPERKEAIHRLEMNPEIINEMVFRNNKSDVINTKGELIFKGKTTKSILIDSSEKFSRFDHELKEYLKKGYSTKNELLDLGKRGGAAIGFVMTVYRKLAASSIAAIHDALVKRLNLLKTQINSAKIDSNLTIESDDRFQGEIEEKLYYQSDEILEREFFSGEVKMLESLILNAKNLMQEDLKLDGLIKHVLHSVINNNPNEKVLIFTEYRSTQSYLQSKLEKEFGPNSVGLINGSLSLEQRINIIESFEDGKTQFLISTEAGGEGINLQHNCHILVNYDLPWNPMRLVQRIGRLYRYGQEKNVIVFNIHGSGTEDENILKMMYSRLNQVVEDLSGVSSEFNPRLHDDILGDLASLSDVQSILEEASSKTFTQTQEQIDKALLEAKEATQKQRELFSFASTFNKQEFSDYLHITVDHCWSFVRGMLDLYNLEIINEFYNGQVVEFKLSEQLLQEFGGKRTNFTITSNRLLAKKSLKTEMMDLNHPLMIFFIKKAQEYTFGGLFTSVPDTTHSAYLVGMAYWQNIQGVRKRRELVSFGIKENGICEVNPKEFSNFLLKKATSTSECEYHLEASRKTFSIFEREFDEFLIKKGSSSLYPENKQFIASLKKGVLANDEEYATSLTSSSQD